MYRAGRIALGIYIHASSALFLFAYLFDDVQDTEGIVIIRVMLDFYQ